MKVVTIKGEYDFMVMLPDVIEEEPAIESLKGLIDAFIRELQENANQATIDFEAEHED